MPYVLGHNQYGKAETHVVRVYRDGDPHEIVDYNVSCALSGDFEDTHRTGDNAKVLTTDAVKNTVNAFAKERGDQARQPESFALVLAEHFVDDIPQVERARVTVEAFAWRRLANGGTGHPHAFVRSADHLRTVTVTDTAGSLSVVSGLRDLTVLKTTDSEFWGFYEDRYTTLRPTRDRVLATSVTAQWCHGSTDVDWARSFESVREALTQAFADAYSYALQHTLWEMGNAVLDAEPGVLEIRFSCPNKHHFAVDLAPFGLENPNEVFHAADRPYGLIEATVKRDESVELSHAYDPGQAW